MFSFLKKSPGEAKAELPAETPAAPSWRERLFKGLAKTRAQWGGKRTGAGRPVQPATEPPATSSCTDQKPDEDHGCAEHKS